MAIKTEQITESLKLMQDKGLYTFSSDATNLFNFLRFKQGLNVVDLGCSTGILSFLIYNKFSPKKMVGVEIQKWAADLFNKNIELNNIKSGLEVFNIDIKGSHKTLGANVFDVAVCNPPYFELTDANINEVQEIAIARHEIKITLEEIVLNASKLLKFGGSLFMCYPAKKLQVLTDALSKYNFAIKQLKVLHPEGTENYKMARQKPAYLVLVKATLGGKKQMEIG